MTFPPLSVGLIGVLGLVGVALYGLLLVRHLIKIVITLQILTKAAVLALVLGGRASGQLALGQSLAVTVLVADIVVAVIGLALALQVRRQFGTLDVQALSDL